MASLKKLIETILLWRNAMGLMGVSFHVGSQCEDVYAYERHISAAAKIAEVKYCAVAIEAAVGAVEAEA